MFDYVTVFISSFRMVPAVQPSQTHTHACVERLGSNTSNECRKPLEYIFPCCAFTYPFVTHCDCETSRRTYPCNLWHERINACGCVIASDCMHSVTSNEQLSYQEQKIENAKREAGKEQINKNIGSRLQRVQRLSENSQTDWSAQHRIS